MEFEHSSSAVAKKLWKILKVVLYMLRKGISKSKLLVDLHVMLKKVKLAGKALAGNFILYHHYSTFTCRSTNNLSFVSPQEYEFSCNNTPFYASYFSKRKSYHHRKSCDIAQNVFEMLNDHEKPEASPFMALPGFGQSPIVRQLRITDSPFPLKEEKDPQLDKEAEDFIRKFYKDLKQQRALSPYNIRAS
ncbi:uncharacterized protein LOC141679595 [Apium graveolens]|uniref:uncharacterized protein LOC141679595 n=1 Tax=Apium graveolens TaxID=4045 RepID=UPI003D7AB398